MWTIRPSEPSDFNFIANSYLKSYRNGPESRFMASESYYPEYKERLEEMMKTGKISVVCAEADPDQILGYVIHGRLHNWGLLHYVYVKYPFRQMGIAGNLMRHVFPEWGERMTICTHLPKNWSELSAKYKLTFDPKYSRS